MTSRRIPIQTGGADDALVALQDGHLHFFRDWPNPAVPPVAAGVYTIWREAVLIYAGMSGRGLSAAQIDVHRTAGVQGKGLFSRLASHASGRRSGDQFCVYVADRLVLQELSDTQRRLISRGELSLDSLIRSWIHEYLAYRFVEVSCGADAHLLEHRVRVGELAAGRPLLNPLRSRTPA